MSDMPQQVLPGANVGQIIKMSNYKGGGGVTPIGAVSRAATGVKMQSNGRGTFWGSVKRSSGVLGPISSIARWPRGMAEILRMRS